MSDGLQQDDDLPVLTQVLRTGAGKSPPAREVGAPEHAAAGTAINLRFDDLDLADDSSSWPRALVIGSDADAHDHVAFEQSAGPVAALSFGPGTTVADPRRIDLRDNDVFLRTAPTELAFSHPFDEPPLVDRQGADADVDPGFDIPLVFRDRSEIRTRDAEAALALRIRDSVLQELSARIDTELDARIAQTLHAGLESALAQLQSSLRVELAEALRDVVGRAVDDVVMRTRDASPPDAAH